MKKGKKVIIVGGGIAGMQTAATLLRLGFLPVVLEKSDKLGGKLNDWHCLFPSFTPAREVLEGLKAQLAGTEIHTGAAVEAVTSTGVTLADGSRMESDAVVVASGFELFDAALKEEYGYGIYGNVITSADLERMFNEGRVCTADGKIPQKIALLHCVGSRDEKVNQRHCSKMCCITGVKQAIELKQLIPGVDIFSFYMDMRMFGSGYEEMYRQAQQEYNIHFIRGRISEASETIDRKIQVKAEDTLIGRPLKMTVDMLILLVGMSAGKSNARISEQNPFVVLQPSGFLQPSDSFLNNACSGEEGLFYAGAATAPKNVGESLNEGVAAAERVAQYLNGKAQG